MYKQDNDLKDLLYNLVNYFIYFILTVVAMAFAIEFALNEYTGLLVDMGYLKFEDFTK